MTRALGIPFQVAGRSANGLGNDWGLRRLSSERFTSRHEGADGVCETESQ
ncbi:hypothetical protein NJ7G_3258 [Natrinema sp. J7-2]|nr:hypothetical protein NJ7G_3258 [Natrinema sp. J7-2]